MITQEHQASLVQIITFIIIIILFSIVFFIKFISHRHVFGCIIALWMSYDEIVPDVTQVYMGEFMARLTSLNHNIRHIYMGHEGMFLTESMKD